MKLLFLVIILSTNLLGTDSTTTIKINGSTIKISISKEFYINLLEFQNFLNSVSQDFHFNEIVVDELTGDNISDTLYNEVYLVNDGCVIKSKIHSNGNLVYMDSTLIFNDEGNWENIWGSDSIYYKLFPYSLLYSCYTIRVRAYTLEREWIDGQIFMYLSLKQKMLEKLGLSKMVIESRLTAFEEYVYKYKGKFINNISPSNPDTYIFEEPLNKYVLFYSP